MVGSFSFQIKPRDHYGHAVFKPLVQMKTKLIKDTLNKTGSKIALLKVMLMLSVPLRKDSRIQNRLEATEKKSMQFI
jgi:hypothetical protein